MAEAVVVQEPNKSSQEWKINVADISWPIFGIFVSILVFKALKNRFFPGGDFQFGSTKVSMNNGGLLAGEDVHEAIDRMIEGKRKVEDKIRSQQTRTIRMTQESFLEIFPDNADPVATILIWARFADELYLAAVENHVMSHVKDGELEREYIEDKMVSVTQTHRRLSSKYKLPSWADIEGKVFLNIHSAMTEFHRIAKTEWDLYKAQAENLATVFSKTNKSAEARIRRLVTGVGE